MTDFPEWVRYAHRPNLGHHPDPDQPTQTRFGLLDATPVEQPEWVCTACLPRANPFAADEPALFNITPDATPKEWP